MKLMLVIGLTWLVVDFVVRELVPVAAESLNSGICYQQLHRWSPFLHAQPSSADRPYASMEGFPIENYAE